MAASAPSFPRMAGAQFGICIVVGASQSLLFLSSSSSSGGAITPQTLVRDVKQKIEEREKIPCALQVLLLAGQGATARVLLDDSSLEDAGVRAQCKLQLWLAREQHPTALTTRFKLAGLLPGIGEYLPRWDTSSVSVLAVLEEVSRRGGANQVSAERKWTEVCQVLHCGNSGVQMRQRFEEIGLLRLADCFPDFIQHEVLNYASHEAGARQANLPSRAMTPLELALFPELVGVVEREKYLCCRNHILQRWTMRCEKELDFDQGIRADLLRINPALAQEWNGLLRIIFFALETLGYFNWGCLHEQQEREKRFIGGCNATDGGDAQSGKRIVVLGAGLAGLSCSLQLARFGHKVELIEARHRVGGRVHSDLKSFSSPVDLGAMLITGVSGHPASVLTHQLRQKKYTVGEHCPIYSLGATLDADVDLKIEARFNAMLSAAAAKNRFTNKAVEDDPQTVQAPAAAAIDAKRKRGRAKRQRQSPTAAAAAATTCSSENLGDDYDGVVFMREEASFDPAIPSKYSGVLWDVEARKWRVHLTRRDTGRQEFLLNAAASSSFLGRKAFDQELDAALAHDAELTKRASANALLYADFSNQTRFPEDFIHVNAAKVVDVQSPVQDLVFEAARDCFSSAVSPAPLWNQRAAPRDASLMDCMMEYNEEEEQSVRGKDVERLESAYLGWHFANLEYACASSLERISNANWDQDDEHDWEGAHVLLPNGFGVLTEGMRRNLQRFPGVTIAMGKPVKQICYAAAPSPNATATGRDVQITCRNGSAHLGDAVVCTASLGVLKDTSEAFKLEFSPALPDWKLGAISRVGFGNLNKIVLEFDQVFWEKTLDIFGRVVHPEVGSRGECYMFWALNRINPRSAIILALVAGDAADEQETRSDDLCISRALAALQETFPAVRPFPRPKACAVTRWRSDPYSRGSYSFMSVGSHGEDYSLLAESVEDKVFFAGEATCRDHPATTGGALLSGLREAAKLASLFGRTTALGDEGDDIKLSEVLRRIYMVTKLVKTLEESKRAALQTVLHCLGRERIYTMQDVKLATQAEEGEEEYRPLQTEMWTHCVYSKPDFVRQNRERAWRAEKIASRLPADWDEEQRLSYLVMRLGANSMDDKEEDDEVGFWV